MNILVINAGSSSLKYQLLNPETQQVLAKGLCERIGIDGKFTYKPEGKQAVKEADVAMPTHNEAIKAVLDALVDPQNGVIGSMKEIDAVGHRVVHGGEKFAKSVLITNEVMAARFSEVMWLVEQVMWKSMDKRVASFLTEESAIEGGNRLSITHETIARHLGTHREVITRILRYFQSEGLVKLSRGVVELTAGERLAELGND